MAAGEIGEQGGAGVVGRQTGDRVGGFGLCRTAGDRPAGDLDGVDGVGKVDAGADLGGFHDPGLDPAVSRVRVRDRVGTFVQGKAVSWADSPGWLAFATRK